MPYLISDIIDHGAGVKEFRLRPQDGRALPAWQPGAHILLRYAGRDGQHYARRYSLVGDAAPAAAYRIAVLRLEDGSGGSRCLHDEMMPGMAVDVDGPHADFPLAPATATRRVLLIGAGIGITPLVSMAHQLRARGIDATLHYLVRSAQRLALLEELESIAPGRVVPHLSAPSGRARLEHILGRYDGAAEYYACGPVPLLQALRQSAAQLGWPQQAMHDESFGARVDDSDRPLSVELTQSQRTLTVLPGTSIHDALIAADVFVSYECKRGECGNCYAAVAQGSPLHRDVCLTAAQRASGMCTCVSWAGGGKLVLDL